MVFRRRWLSLPVALVLMACDATHAHRGVGEEVAVVAERELAARPIDVTAQRNCPERTREALVNRTSVLTTSALDVGLADAPVPVCLDVGQALRVHLPASPAIGYEWVLEDGVPPLLRVETDPGTEPASRLRTGTGTLQSWGFRAERSGHAVLRFAYRRPWEASSIPTRTARFDVIVR